MKFHLWLDRHDTEMVQIGKSNKRGGFVCWGQMHIDGISEMFGDPAYELVKGMRGDPSRPPLEFTGNLNFDGDDLTEPSI